MSMVYLTDENLVAQQRKVVNRRRLFAQAFTPEVQKALAEFLGVDEQIFAFEGDFDPYRACQKDALAGVVRGIAWEIEHLPEAEEALAAMLSEQGKEATNE